MNCVPAMCLLFLAATILPHAVAADDVERREVSPAEVQLADVQKLIEAIPPDHPRLLARESDFQALRGALDDRTSTRGMLARAVVQHADLILDLPPITRTLEGRRLLTQSRRCLERLTNLAMAYQLTGATKYAERGMGDDFTCGSC